MVTVSSCRVLSLFSLSFSAPPLLFYGLLSSTDSLRRTLTSPQLQSAQMSKFDNLGQLGGEGWAERFIGLAQYPSRKSTNGPRFVSQILSRRKKIFSIYFFWFNDESPSPKLYVSPPGIVRPMASPPLLTSYLDERSLVNLDLYFFKHTKFSGCPKLQKEPKGVHLEYRYKHFGIHTISTTPFCVVICSWRLCF